MPIYEYACDSCGHEFEKLMKMSADAPPCPECGSEVRKKVSAAGFILKGGGWYKDLYSSPKPGADKGDSAGSTSESKSESKSESAA